MRKITPFIVWNNDSKEVINAIFHTSTTAILDFNQILSRKYESMHDMIKTVVRIARENSFRIDHYNICGGVMYDIPVYDVTNNTVGKYLYKE